MGIKNLLTPDFKMNLRWFAKFLPKYNGVSLYNNNLVDLTLELDVCLTGFGGRCGCYVYHMPIERGFRNWTIVHLEMVNILIAIRLFTSLWASKKILIRCDNEAVVTVHKSGKTRDLHLATCACNVWYASVMSDIEIPYAHIRGSEKGVADILSRWQGTPDQVNYLHSNVKQPIWLSVSYEMLDLDPEM